MSYVSIVIEEDEDGFILWVDHFHRYRIENPEDLYDQVKARIGPWLRERNEARATSPFRGAFACDPDESGGYDVSDPKHPNWHSLHADLYDSREGK